MVSKVQGLKLGAEDYMVKPFEVLELLVRMEKVLERRKDEEADGIWKHDSGSDYTSCL